MNPARLMTLDVTIVHVTQTGAADEYGNPTEQTTETTVKGERQQVGADEQNRDANVAADTEALFLVPTATVDAGDRVRIAGATFEVIGPPWTVRHPRSGETTHIEARIRRTA